MKTRQRQAVWTLAIAIAVWALVSSLGGVLTGGTQAAMTSATTINQPAAMSRTPEVTSCTRPENVGSARCNDMRHFAGEWNGGMSRNQQGAPEIDCDEAGSFQTARCNDSRHLGPMSR